MNDVVQWIIRLIYVAIGVAYITAGSLLLFYGFGAIPALSQFEPVRYPFGGLLVIYGCFRIYRGLKRKNP